MEQGLRHSGKTIGSGAFGIVSLAFNITQGKFEVAKTLTGKNNLKDFQKENRALEKIKGTPAEKFFITASAYAKRALCNGEKEYIIFMPHAGESVGSGFIDTIQLLSTNQPKTLASVEKNISKQLIQALFELHRLNFAHRDIKLDNIAIGPDLKLRIIDLGFLKEATQKITAGTPAYFPPEAIINTPHHYNSINHDIWSAAVVLLEMFVLKNRAAPASIQADNHWQEAEDTNNTYKPITLAVDGKHIPIQYYTDAYLTPTNTFKVKHYKMGLDSSLRKEDIPGNTLQEVIALMLLADPKKRASAEELLKLPYFK